MSPRRWIAVAVALGLVLVGLAVWLLRPGPAPAPAAPAPAAPAPAPVTPSPSVPPPVHGPCVLAPDGPFVPASATVAGRTAAVRPVGRTADGVMGVLPDADKTEFATDLGGVRAGSRHGRVLLNTHTWPDGTALGNRLLARLQVGDRIVLRGHRSTLCYRVASREQVQASAGYPGWDRTTGRPGLAIVVCSGTRLGPGQWTDRTLWFATPYLGGRPPA